MIKDLFTFLLSVIFLILLFSLCLISASDKFLSADNITKAVKKTDFTKVLKESEISSSLKKILVMSDVEEKVADDVINSDATKEFVGNYVGSSIEATIKGKEVKEITDADVVFLVDGNMDVISKSLGKELDSKTKEDIMNGVKDNAYLLADNMPSAEKVIEMTGNSKLNEILTISKFVYSDKTKESILIILGVITVLMILLRYKYLTFLKSLGVPTLINGMIIITISYFLKDTLVNIILSSSNMFKVIFDPIIDNLFKIFFKFGIISFAIGLLMIVIYKVLKTLVKK